MSALYQMQPMQPMSVREERAESDRWEELHSKLSAGGIHDFADHDNFVEAIGEIGPLLWDDIHRLLHEGKAEQAGRILAEQAYAYWMRQVGL